MIKICPECININISNDTCSYCGFPFEIKINGDIQDYFFYEIINLLNDGYRDKAKSKLQNLIKESKDLKYKILSEKFNDIDELIERSKDYYLNAKDKFEKLIFDEAIQNLNNAISIESKNEYLNLKKECELKLQNQNNKIQASKHFNNALNELSQNKHHFAFNSIRTAIELDPENKTYKDRLESEINNYLLKELASIEILIKNKEFVEADIKLNGVFKLRTDDSRLTILKQNIEKGILSADKKQKSKRTIVIALLIISGSIFGYYLFQRYVEYENWATIVKDTSIVNVQAYIAANSTSKYLSLANEKLRELLLKDSLEKANQEELRRIELSLATSKIPTTPEELFIQWEKEIESKGIFDYVSETDCMDRNKMDDLYYNQSKYPMHTTSKEIITFDYNSDGISDYLINYNLENCVNGNGWATDFIFIVSSSGKLVIDQDLSKIIKTQFYDYVKSNYSSDPYVYLDNSYLVTNALNISSISNGIGFGNFKLLQNGPSCCPEITGDFEFNFTTSELTFSNIVKNTNDKIE